MNNISLWEILYPQKLRTNRIYKIMKITLTLVFVSIFSMFAGNIHSQNARITFTKNNATLESVLNEIENQTDYLFIINSNIDTHQKVSVRADDTPVSKVLDELFHDTEIHYTMEGSHIVLSNKPQPAILQQTRKITP
jgi:type II secretory pathway component GspD/PulD (secretin)